MELLVLRGHNDAINSIAWSPDNERLATAGWDDTVIVWNLDGEQMLRLNGADLYLVNWSPNGKQLATTCGIWDAESGEQTVMLEGDSEWVLSLAWSQDGTRLATGSRDEAVKIWDVESGRMLLALTGHSGEVESIAWNPDGTQLATGGHDATVKIWDAQNGKEVLSLNLSDSGSTTWCVAWSPHGKWLATGGNYGAKIWKPGTNKELLTLSEDLSIHGLSWSPDGKRIATGNSAGIIRIWDIAKEQGEEVD
jgi:WD40 repeat protein